MVDALKVDDEATILCGEISCCCHGIHHLLMPVEDSSQQNQNRTGDHRLSLAMPNGNRIAKVNVGSRKHIYI